VVCGLRVVISNMGMPSFAAEDAGYNAASCQVMMQQEASAEVWCTLSVGQASC